MKILVGLLVTTLLALCCSIAFAGTATLGSESCSLTDCYNVPNDSGLKISYISIGTSSLSISLNGTTIYARGYLSPTTISTVHLQDGTIITTYVFENIVLDEVFGGVPGTIVTLSIVWTEVDKPCVRLGRGESCPRTVTLNDGTLVTP